MDLTPLHQLARTQYGAIGRHQLGAVGITPSRRRSLVTRGILVHSIGDSYALFEVSRSREHLAAAATLAWGGRGVVSHRTAAWLWDCWEPSADEPIDVAVGGRRHHMASDEGVAFHTPRDHHNLTPIRRRGLRVTIPTRTIIDCAAVEPGATRSLIERMLLAGHVSRDHLIAAVAQHSRRGRSGIGPVRRVLRDWPYSDQVAESVLELRMQTLLHGTSFAHYVTQLEIGPYRVDFAWVDERIVLECDGWGKVDSPEHFEKAARRDSFLQTQGWIVLHFTWGEITRRPNHVMNEIQRAFHLRRFGETGGRFTRNT
jgi:very-short-patch-repair endonuclease